MQFQNVRIYLNLSARYKAAHQRVLSIQQRVEGRWKVTHHFNLTLGTLLELQTCKTWSVDKMLLSNVSTSVGKKTAQRIACGKIGKTPHAYLKGDLETTEVNPSSIIWLGYRPAWGQFRLSSGLGKTVEYKNSDLVLSKFGIAPKEQM